MATAAIIYNPRYANGYDYGEVMDKDPGVYYQDNRDPVDDATVAVVASVDPDAERPQADYTIPVRLQRRNINAADDTEVEAGENDISAEAEEHRSIDQCAGLCLGNGGKVEAPPAVKDTQDAIERVTSLIKAMREHAIEMIKDMSDLESQFLSSCDEHGANNNSSQAPPPQPPVEQPQMTTCASPTTESSPGNSMCPTGGYKSHAFGIFENIKNQNNPNQDSRYMKNENTGTMSPYFYINDYGAPIKNDKFKGTLNYPPSELVQQAQEAVKSWKEQIENCRRLLDDAVAEATQNVKLESGGGSGGLLGALKHARNKENNGEATVVAKESKDSKESITSESNAKTDTSEKNAALTNTQGTAIAGVAGVEGVAGVTSAHIVAKADTTSANNGKSGGESKINNNANNLNNDFSLSSNNNDNNDISYNYNYNSDASFDNVINDNENNASNSNGGSTVNNGNSDNSKSSSIPKIKNFRKRKYSGKYDKLLRDSNIWSFV